MAVLYVVVAYQGPQGSFDGDALAESSRDLFRGFGAIRDYHRVSLHETNVVGIVIRYYEAGAAVAAVNTMELREIDVSDD